MELAVPAVVVVPVLAEELPPPRRLAVLLNCRSAFDCRWLALSRGTNPLAESPSVPSSRPARLFAFDAGFIPPPGLRAEPSRSRGTSVPLDGDGGFDGDGGAVDAADKGSSIGATAPRAFSAGCSVVEGRLAPWSTSWWGEVGARSVGAGSGRLGDIEGRSAPLTVQTDRAALYCGVERAVTSRSRNPEVAPPLFSLGAQQRHMRTQRILSRFAALHSRCNVAAD